MMEDYRNKKECEGCHKEIPRIAKKCPFCEHYYYPYMFEKNSPNIKRNKEMVKTLESEGFTLEQVGEKYNITRERVRQLYRITAKKPYTTLLVKRRRAQQKAKAIKEETKKNTIQFYCRDCNNPVPLSERHPYQQTICRECYRTYKKELRSWRVSKVCKQCGKKFHPYANNVLQFFCSRECYTKSGRGQKLITTVVSSVFRINNRVVQSYA